MDNINTNTNQITDIITIIETNLDDASGENLGFLMNKLLQHGALDVSYTPVQMKKNRPGVKLTIMTNKEHFSKLINLVFLEAGTLGVRVTEASRLKCERSFVEVNTELGKIKTKIASWQGQVVNIKPEYEDCKALALEHNVPLKKVQNLALKAYRNKIEQ